MAMTMHLDIVSAEEGIFSGTVHEVYAPSKSGELGIFPRHAQLLSQLVPGEVRVKAEGHSEMLHFFVSGGMLEVQPHVVTVLADTAIRAKDLDEAQALEAKQRAEEAMGNREAEADYARAQAELIQAEAQLRMIKNIRSITRG
ncbi:F0F1 ATP synthase subunit epsilon [Acidihalobacter ferrooxydans]|uniref:ATP synthase epsilon chain n=1 Tax=Acidihalobacter ferrooxydans TaxID=1765967 RepID=A0A1P8UKR3_9GAMM|nr:F0F1 ATP synthase subunit epsilon [Acidihalobacter ferrooxydans]APZ44420.1 F0F1 ATP synthase subunit epsilon [Acidihalobacter ferrooxydans]